MNRSLVATVALVAVAALASPTTTPTALAQVPPPSGPPGNQGGSCTCPPNYTLDALSGQCVSYVAPSCGCMNDADCNPALTGLTCCFPGGHQPGVCIPGGDLCR
jgi:hypothetical protein